MKIWRTSIAVALVLKVNGTSAFAVPTETKLVPTRAIRLKSPFSIVLRTSSASFADYFLLLPHQRRPKSSTTLQVSELHIPGYSKSKLSFLLDDDDIIQERTYNPQTDYISDLPYQDGHLIHRTTTPIFTSEECQSIVFEAEHKALQMGWTTNRHGNYPTTDLPIVELPNTLEFFKVALVERIYPLLRSQFGKFLPDGGKNLRVADGFVVKYDSLGGQTELKPHRDGSILSFNIALNSMDEFEGGGTWFASLGKDDEGASLKIDRGEIVSHSSSLLHGGFGITKGTRYIMVCFVILEGYDSWSMRFYNQVRNL
ncbi:hypothetical protein ACHAXS_002637 [Conticribra weissflogii]